MVKNNPVFLNRNENRCRRAGLAYSRANGSRDILLMILRRFCPLIRSELIDILSTATPPVVPHFQVGPVRPPWSRDLIAL